jgi:hypothetical protein
MRASTQLENPKGDRGWEKLNDTTNGRKMRQHSLFIAACLDAHPTSLLLIIVFAAMAPAARAVCFHAACKASQHSASCSQNLKNARNCGMTSGSLLSISFGIFQTETAGLDRKVKNKLSWPSSPICMWMFHFDLQDQLYKS